ncbi:MAG: YlxR family protein [Coriobacteriia bacterium]|nr:YlxR family protein [Coriobacteriia bacterium]
MSKKIPMRTCVACRHSASKASLIRIVRQADNRLAVDAKGNLPGRGAYICADQDCLERAQRNKHLDRALKTTIDEQGWIELMKYFHELYPQLVREQD